MKENVYLTEGEFYEKPHAQLREEGKRGSVDWKASPHEVLEEVDVLLRRYELEINIFQFESDSYDFTILPVIHEGSA